MQSRAALGDRSPRSHYDVILIVTSFATYVTVGTVRNGGRGGKVSVRTYALPRLS